LTATAAEINKLDGVTATTAEINKLDGVTATTAEINKLDGATATTGDLNKLADITATAAEINKLDGATLDLAAVTATAAEVNVLDGSTATTADLNKLADVTATAAELNTLDDINTAGNFGLIPSGGIIMWSGTIANIPSGWALCNGANGTPDLRNRFVVGAGSSYSPGNTGGADSVTLTEAQMPSHTHSVSGSTNTAGEHRHLVVVGIDSSSSGLSADQSISTFSRYGGNNNARLASRTEEPDGGRTTLAGSHSHTVTGTAAASGGGTGTAAASGGGTAHENRPPFYALAYIQKL
jgi:microcystin-dependent protein